MAQQVTIQQASDIKNIVLVPSNFFEIIDKKTENKVYNDIDKNGYVYLVPCDNGKYELERWEYKKEYAMLYPTEIVGVRVTLTDSTKPKPTGWFSALFSKYILSYTVSQPEQPSCDLHSRGIYKFKNN